MKFALVDGNDTVVNLIVIDPKNTYTPDEGLRVLEVNDWIEIGHQWDMPLPSAKPGKTDTEKKIERNDNYKNDLSLKASYLSEKKSNPNLSFSDFLDNLEATVVQ